MEAALELDDDVFFADLSKQISLLIMDDDDEEGDSFYHHYPSANLQGFSNTFHPPLQASYPAYDHPLACRRESKGTGVFIPRSSHRRRRNNNKNKQGNYTASGNKFMRPPSDQNSREFIIPQMNYYNINTNNPSDDRSFYLRRF